MTMGMGMGMIDRDMSWICRDCVDNDPYSIIYCFSAGNTLGRKDKIKLCEKYRFHESVIPYVR